MKGTSSKGGYGTDDLVTEYRLSDGRETALTPLKEKRENHACGVYQDEDGQQVSGEVQTSWLLITNNLF